MSNKDVKKALELQRYANELSTVVWGAKRPTPLYLYLTQLQVAVIKNHNQALLEKWNVFYAND